MTQAPPQRREPLPSKGQVQVWKIDLYNKTLLIGWAVRQLAFSHLTHAASIGSRDASLVLAKALVDHPNGDVRANCAAFFSEPASLNQAVTNAMWQVWHQTRHPLMLELLLRRNKAANTYELYILSLTKLNQLQEAAAIEAFYVKPVVDLLFDSDPELRQRAQIILASLQNASARTQLCSIWAKTSLEQLVDPIKRLNHLPRGPIELRVPVALLLDRRKDLGKISAEAVPVLHQICAGKYPALAQEAEKALLTLTQPEARDALCKIFIDTADPLACRLSLQAGYLPSDTSQRVLFLFLAEQWDAYSDLDFDHSILGVFFNTADTPLRLRLIRTLQKIGHMDWLPQSMHGEDNNQLNDTEADAMIRMLVEHKSWERLWNLVFELSPYWGAVILEHLRRHLWQPTAPDEIALFQEFAHLNLTPGEMKNIFARIYANPAIKQAQLRFSGRMNDLAFAPHQPWLALGSGNGRVTLWNYQKGETHAVLNSFDHAIGQVAFSSSGALLCAERTNKTEAACSLYSWKDGQLDRIAKCKGSFTSLNSVDDHVLTSSRDGRVALWNVQTHAKRAETFFSDWMRAAHVSPDQQVAVFLDDNQVTLLSLPTLQIIPAQFSFADGHYHGIQTRGVPRSASFVPPGSSLLIGKANGNVIYSEFQPAADQNLFSIKNTFIEPFDAGVVSMEYLPEMDVLIAASADGFIRFYQYSSKVLAARLQVEDETITSLKISPDAQFMAVGTREASMTLWDLRLLRVSGLLNYPVASTSSADYALVKSLLQCKGIPEDIMKMLHHLEGLYHHRFRYDILVDEAPAISYGDFDILL